MRQLTVRARSSRVVFVVAAVVLLACAALSLVPGRASATGAGGGEAPPKVLLPVTNGPCGQERVPVERAQCEGRRAAKAEANRRQQQGEAQLSQQWKDAVDSSRGVHWRDTFTNRRIALIVGGVWLFLALRRERRLRRSRRRAA